MVKISQSNVVHSALTLKFCQWTIRTEKEIGFVIGEVNDKIEPN